MIDTITIMTKKTIVGQSNGLTIEYNNPSENRHIVITYDDGDVKYNIDNVYLNHEGIYNLDYWRDITFVTFSPAKVLSKDSINYPVITSPEQLEDAFNVVWETTEQEGIYLPDYTSSSVKICKLHITRDIILDNPFEDYLPCLDTLISPYKKSNTFETTRYWQNKQNAICIYDKTEQLNDVHNYFDIPDNTIRVEYRLEKARKVKGLLGTNTASYILNNWYLLEEVFTKEMTRLYEPAVYINDCLDDTEYFKETYGKKYMNEYIKWLGMIELYQKVGIEGVKSMYKCQGFSRQYISTKMKEFRTLINTVPVGNPHSKLYAEFRTKLLD